MQSLSDIFNSSIQLGFDIATSLTIIGSLSYFVISMRKRAKEERVQRFDKQVRAVAAEQLRASIERLSELFIEEVIGQSTKFNRSFGLSSSENFEREIKKLQKDGQVKLAFNLLGSANSSIGEFYETLHKEKYNIVPVIDSIEDDSALVEQFNKQLDSINHAFNNQNRSAKALMGELITIAENISEYKTNHKLKNFQDFHKKADESDEFSKFMHSAASIFYDEDYLHWTPSFVSDEETEVLVDGIKNTTSINDMTEHCQNLFLNACVTLIKKLFDAPENLYVQVLYEASRQQNEANNACKEILINLSAILKYLLKTDNDHTSLIMLVERYKKEEYFGLDSTIR